LPAPDSPQMRQKSEQGCPPVILS